MHEFCTTFWADTVFRLAITPPKPIFFASASLQQTRARQMERMLGIGSAVVMRELVSAIKIGDNHGALGSSGILKYLGQPGILGVGHRQV